MPKWPPPVYRVRIDFDAPLDYVFRWCTDYRADDPKRAQENFVRRVLERKRRSFVLQDLWKTPTIWYLNHNRTTLYPPDRWHVDSFGTLRTLSIDYQLHPLSRRRTRLEIRLLRRPTEAFPSQPSRAAYEGDLDRLWRHYARSLNQDYRAHSARTRRRKVSS